MHVTPQGRFGRIVLLLALTLVLSIWGLMMPGCGMAQEEEEKIPSYDNPMKQDDLTPGVNQQGRSSQEGVRINTGNGPGGEKPAAALQGTRPAAPQQALRPQGPTQQLRPAAPQQTLRPHRPVQQTRPAAPHE